MAFPIGISEIVLLVNDVPSAAKFYQGVVGLVLCREVSADWAWFWVGDPNNQQRLALHKGALLFEEHSPLPDGKRFGKTHFALHISANDLENAVARVRDSGCDVYGPVEFTWMKAISYYFYDPSGNLLEFWAPQE
ncbi:VOC family protein [bacterium AH-315-F03]|nr:VOC family protein [bacterium AH-315-F03]